MLPVVVLFSICWTAYIPGVLSETSQANCEDVSKDVDNWVFQSNYQILTGGDDILDVDGFGTTMRPYFLGIPLPFTVHMKVPKGELHSLDKLKRVSPVSTCMNSTTANYTSGIFQYDDMKIAYDRFKAKFLFWELEGKFTYEFEPKLNVIVKKSDAPLDNDCGPIKPLTLASSTPSSYVIETDDSWKSWFLKKVLHRALVSDDNTPMLQMFLHRAWVSIDTNYCRYSC